jgi:excisionase family DNA binding protein
MTSIPFRQRFSATIPEACEGTGVGRTKIYELIKTGRVRTSKVGTRTVVLVDPLIAAIDPEAAAASGKEAA